MPRLEAIVVGAGVGGCACAVALQQAGWSVTVLERRPDRNEPAGSGISLWPNALRALDMLGLGDVMRSGAALGGRSGVRAPTGQWIGRTDLADAIVRRYGLPLVLTRRDSLLCALVDALGANRIEYGVLVEDAGTVDERAWIRTGGQKKGGQERTADLVVLADGGRSALRRAVLAVDPVVRYAGYTSWRFICPRPTTEIEPAETWGPRGQRFAILPLDEQHVYCYATANAEAGGHSDDERGELQARFGGWHAPIPALLDALELDDVIRTDIIDLAKPPTTLHRGRLVLLGDAAHAMTPDLGQGGCQALEDAVTLAACTALTGADVNDALSAYSAARGSRGADLVRRSRRAGRLYQAPPWASRMTARLTGLLPASILVRALAPVLDWQPPTPTWLE